MTRKRIAFDASFKLEVVKMIRERGLSVMQICQDMNLGETAVCRLLRQAEADNYPAFFTTKDRRSDRDGGLETLSYAAFSPPPIFCFEKIDPAT